MKQSINLYTDAFRPSREWLTLGRALGVGALVLLVVAGVSGVLRYQLAGAQARLEDLASRESRKQQSVETLQDQVEARQKDPALEQQVTRLEQRVRDRRRLVERADSVAQASSEGFTPYLEGLARQSLDGLWLTRIRVDLMRDRLGLAGRTRDGQNVPEYLQRLQEESVFEGRRFARFVIERPEGGEPLSFEVASTRDTPEEDE
ncbi:PilN domain-containing protein [Salicola sp. Rm-C-2C1-2]|uniref:PilN domain-containing protein n=1 Tax=Salicola sp. Rm-C-2C1-2 TaxID=3141321 RepID=UPI0032E529D3